MYQLLCPSLFVDSVHDIQLESLQRRNIQGLILDLDNTILIWDENEFAPEILSWLQNVHLQGFKVVLVSNNHRTRVEKMAGILQIPFIHRALKPTKSGFYQAMKIMDLPAEQIAVVGDQLFTDILGGNRMGFFTILVKSLSSKEFIGTRLTRQLEKVAVKILKAKGLLK